MTKRSDILAQTGCSGKQLNRWVAAGLIPSPKRSSGCGTEGATYNWDDDVIDRIRIIQTSLKDKRMLVDAGFELFLTGFSMPKPKLVRDVLHDYLERQLHLFYSHRPTIPDQPSPSDRRAIMTMPEKYDLPVTAKLADFMTEEACYLAGMPTKYSYDDRPVIKRNYRSSPSFLPSPFKQRELIKKASDHALQQAVSDATYQLEQQRIMLNRHCYAIGLSPEHAATIFLPGHTCKEQHDITEALRPLMTVYALYRGEHRETLDHDFIATAFGWYMEELRKVLPELQELFESQQFHAALSTFPM